MHSLVSRLTDRKKKFLVLFAAVTMSITALAAPINAAPVAQSSTTDSGLGSVYFAPMSSKLSNNAKRDIDTILAANPGVQKFNVVGYSQWAPWATAKSYKQISMLRAASVTSYMKSKGVTVEILNESGGLPETGAKTSKARKATIFSVAVSVQTAVASTSTEPEACEDVELEVSTNDFYGWLDETNYLELQGTDVQLFCALDQVSDFIGNVRITSVSEISKVDSILNAATGNVRINISKETTINISSSNFHADDFVFFEIDPDLLLSIIEDTPTPQGDILNYQYQARSSLTIFAQDLSVDDGINPLEFYTEGSDPIYVLREQE